MGIRTGRFDGIPVLLFLAGIGIASGQTPAALNLSHDLVTKGIAQQNMTPDTPGLDSRPLFQAAVAYASANQIPAVTADRGKYYFLSQSNPYYHVFLKNIANVTVDFQYSDLYFAHGNIVAISASASTNLTLKNFTVDYLQLPFTQLTVTGVNVATSTVNFKQYGNYPLASALNALTVPSTGYNISGYPLFFFRNGKQLRTTGRMEAAAPFNDTSIRITSTGPGSDATALSTIQPGDAIVVTYRAGLSTLSAEASTGFTLQNVSVYASGFVGVGTYLSSATVIDHVQVIPRPGTDRLISTNADGIHLAQAGANNMVTNNTVRRGCDDGIAIDGQWYAIVNAPNNGASVQVKRNIVPPLAIGGSFDFINILTGAVAGTATIVAEDPPPGQQTGAAGEAITLTLDHAINGLLPNFGVTPSDPNLRGSGTIISGNLVREENFVRGIYPAGVKNVTVTDNMTESTNGPGILVEQDEALAYGYKTGPSSGIAIKNNIVDNALGWGAANGGVVFAGGAINVVAYDQDFAWVATQPFSNISITGNFISNSIRSGIRMENVAGGQITGNTILNYATAPTDFVYFVPRCCETQAQVEADFKQPVVVAASTAVTNSNNVSSGPWIANVSNADGGYRLAPGSIAVAYGQNLAPSLVPAGVQPLPPTLAGLTVTVKDSAGVSRPAGLYYVSPGQVAYVVPQGTARGVATVTVGNTPSAALIAPVGPGLLTADGSGSGVALAAAVRASADGTQVPVPVFQCGSAGCHSVPMDLGSSTDTLVVVFYGTGIRGRSSLGNVVAQIGGEPAKVLYAGGQSQYDGLDQVNIVVPSSLAGAGEVPVVLTVDGGTANVVTIDIK